MRLPKLEHPETHAGLFVVDFGRTCSVGYTAEEVAWLMESEANADAKVYRIHGAEPDGTMMLKGVPTERFSLESGMFFHSRDGGAARADFESLKALAETHPLPCRAQLILAWHGRPGHADESHGRDACATTRLPFVAGLAYPAECDEDVSRWLLDHDVRAGEYADGGIGRLEQMRQRITIIDSAQLHARPARASRSREEVFAAVGEPIQRRG